MEEINSDDFSNSDAKMADSPEESSWTFYIEGFMCENDMGDDRNSCFSSDYESPSLVSDAASSAVQKFKDKYNSKEEEDIMRISSGKSKHFTICKQSSFRKQKNKTMHELEDTASSPVNSPKQISYMNQFMNHKEKGEMEVKRNIFAKGRGLTAGSDADYTDLKKRSCS